MEDKKKKKRMPLGKWEVGWGGGGGGKEKKFCFYVVNNK